MFDNVNKDSSGLSSAISSVWLGAVGVGFREVLHPARAHRHGTKHSQGLLLEVPHPRLSRHLHLTARLLVPVLVLVLTWADLPTSALGRIAISPVTTRPRSPNPAAASASACAIASHRSALHIALLYPVLHLRSALLRSPCPVHVPASPALLLCRYGRRHHFCSRQSSSRLFTALPTVLRTQLKRLRL